MGLCLLAGYSFADGKADLNQLTSRCAQAAKNYRPVQKDFYYKVLHTVEYVGWIGDTNSFELNHPIAMVVRYAGSKKQGHYWFQHKPQKKYAFTVKSDMAGNIKFIPKDHECIDYVFQGIMKKGSIMGLWKNAQDNKSFAFFVYHKEQADN